MSMSKLIPSSALRPLIREKQWASVTAPLVIGKDILELLSSSMYVESMSIYREYVQNAADSIDDARVCGLISNGSEGRVDFSIDAETRTVKIRDNGSGLPESEFVQRLTSFGASPKRGRHARGFRGVGRLAGLGYCQELIFRSRTTIDHCLNELRWDCKKLKTLLRNGNAGESLSDMVKQTVTVRRMAAAGWPQHFFEVELRGIVRHRNDQLLDPVAIHAYLSQVAPVPFSPEFQYARDITAKLRPLVKLGDLQIRISGIDDLVYRPHRNCVDLGPDASDVFKDLQFFSIPAVDGGVAAVGWVLHHGYPVRFRRTQGLEASAYALATFRLVTIACWKSSLLRHGSTYGLSARFMSLTSGSFRTADGTTSSRMFIITICLLKYHQSRET